jgi:hypothetical protein
MLRHQFILAGVLPVVLAGWVGAEEVLVVEQDYNLVRADKEGPAGTDGRQRMCVAEDWIRIDEFAGTSKQPVETYLIDLEKKLIVNLDNEKLTKTVETFDQRRERLEQKKKKIRTDLDNLPEGPQKKKTEQLYRALLDDERSYKLVADKKAEKKKIADVECVPMKIVDQSSEGYEPMTAYLHPELEMPHNSADILYLLHIVGPHMRDFLNKNKSQCRRLPMELTADLPVGGTLHVQVTKVEKVKRDKLDPNLMSIPEGYKEKVVGPPKADTNAKPD